MRMQKLVSAAFATAALASTAVPALAYTVYPDVDFEWYANVGRMPPAYYVVDVMPPPRKGEIWSPARWEVRNARHYFVAGRWVKDDYQQQLAEYNYGKGTLVATNPPILLDKDGNPIPLGTQAYPVESATTR